MIDQEYFTNAVSATFNDNVLAPIPHSFMKGDMEVVDISEINTASLTTSDDGIKRPFGFLVDIGAPRSVIGQKELHRIRRTIGSKNLALVQSNRSFKFAEAVYQSLGMVVVPLETTANILVIHVVMDVVTADIPALLGLDLMDQESLTPCVVSGRFIKRAYHQLENGEKTYFDEWSVPSFRSKSNHIYVKISMPINAHFSRAQLMKIHRNFYHPSAGKLFNLLLKSRPEDATPEARKTLEDISRRCGPCQRISSAPRRFRVSFGTEHIKFNERVIMDIMYIDGEPILHIVDDVTRFNAAYFLPDVSTETIWTYLVRGWFSIYTGKPNKIMVDQGSSFGQIFIDLAFDNDI